MNGRKPPSPAGRASFSHPLTEFERDALQECVDQARAYELRRQVPNQWEQLKKGADYVRIAIPKRAFLDEADPSEFKAVMGGKHGAATLVKSALKKALDATPEPLDPYRRLRSDGTRRTDSEMWEANDQAFRRSVLLKALEVATWFQDFATGEALKDAIAGRVANLLGEVTTTKDGRTWTAIAFALKYAGFAGNPQRLIARLRADKSRDAEGRRRGDRDRKSRKRELDVRAVTNLSEIRSWEMGKIERINTAAAAEMQQARGLAGKRAAPGRLGEIQRERDEAIRRVRAQAEKSRRATQRKHDDQLHEAEMRFFKDHGTMDDVASVATKRLRALLPSANVKPVRSARRRDKDSHPGRS